jgi:hypothetical protein
MFKKPIVLIIGAGASFDIYGLPLGGELATKIAKATDFYWDHHLTRPSRGDADLFEKVIYRKYGHDQNALNRYTSAGQSLAAAISSAVSVDDALYQLSENPEAVQLGKICIMRSILEAESKCKIKPTPAGNPEPGAGKDGWIEQIFSMAITGLKQSELERAFENVTFVNFNYDRCIEHYLYWAMQRIGLPAERAMNIVEGLNIIRPYGTLGSIFSGTKSYLQFGAGARQEPFDMIGRIRTFTESEVLHDKDKLMGILSDAGMILFLGFGFHAQNLQLLRQPKTTGLRPVKVIATVYGVDGANLPELTNSISKVLRIRPEYIETHDMTASQLLQKLRLKINLTLG